MVSQPNLDPYTKNFLRTSVAQEMFDIEMPPPMPPPTTPPPEGQFGRAGGEAAHMPGMSSASETVYGSPPSRGWNGATNQLPRKSPEAMGGWSEGPQQQGGNLRLQSEQILVNPPYDAGNAQVFSNSFGSPQSRFMSQRISNWETYPKRQDRNILSRANEFSQPNNNPMEYGSSGTSNFQASPRGNDLNQEFIPRNGQYQNQGNSAPSYQNQGSNKPNYQNQGSNPPNYQNQGGYSPNNENQGNSEPNYQNQGNNPPNYRHESNIPPNYQYQDNNPQNYQDNNPQNYQDGNPSNYQNPGGDSRNYENRGSNPPNFQNQRNANNQRQRSIPENSASVYQNQDNAHRNVPMNTPQRFQNYESNSANFRSSRNTVNSQSNAVPKMLQRNTVSHKQFETTTTAPLPNTMPDNNPLANMPTRSEAVGNNAGQSMTFNRDANAQENMPFRPSPARDNPMSYQMDNNSNQRNDPFATPRYTSSGFLPQFNSMPGPFMGRSQPPNGSEFPPQIPLGRNIFGRAYSMPPFVVSSNTKFPADLSYYRQPSMQLMGAFPFRFEPHGEMQATPPPQMASFAAMRMPSSQDILKSGHAFVPRTVPSPQMMDQMMAMVGIEGVEVI